MAPPFLEKEYGTKIYVKSLHKKCYISLFILIILIHIFLCCHVTPNSIWPLTLNQLMGRTRTACKFATFSKLRQVYMNMK